MFQEAQIPLLACVLIAACVAKLAIKEADDTIGPGTLAALRRYRPVVVVVAAIEGGLGLALFVTARPAVRLATVVVFAVATSVVAELRARRRDEGCGCFGGLSTTPVRLRTLLRASLFTVVSLAVLTVPATGLDVVREGFGWRGVIVAAELVLFACLSPEIGAMLARRRERIPCEQRTVSLSETYEVLRASAPWREHEATITAAEPTDVWRELCWRFVVYPGYVDGKEVEIVFAVSTEERDPTVRAAIVEPDDSDTGPNPVYAMSV